MVFNSTGGDDKTQVSCSDTDEEDKSDEDEEPHFVVGGKWFQKSTNKVYQVNFSLWLFLDLSGTHLNSTNNKVYQVNFLLWLFLYLSGTHLKSTNNKVNFSLWLFLDLSMRHSSKYMYIDWQLAWHSRELGYKKVILSDTPSKKQWLQMNLSSI